MHLVKYGVREHIDQFFRDGTVQIGTVRSYDTATHGSMIGDDEEGLSFQTITDDTVHLFRARGDNVPAFFGAPGCSGNVAMQTNVSFNYAIYSLSYVLHRDLCRDFSADYDAAFFIDCPIVFFYELTKAFSASGLINEAIFQHVDDIQYSSRALAPEDEIVEALVKPPQYAHQREVRGLWNVGTPAQQFYRFKAPEARRCCRLVPWERMPDYPAGSLTPEQEWAAVRRAVYGDWTPPPNFSR